MTTKPHFIESIKITRVSAKGGFNAEQPEEMAFLFIEQMFDKQGNKIKEIIYSEEGEAEQTIEYTYNNDKQLVSETHFFHLDEIDEKTNFTYENGLLSKKEKLFSYGSIETTHYQYNSYQMPISITVLDDQGSEEESEHFVYEGKQLLHYVKQNALIGKEQEVWMKYDEKQRLVEEKKWNNHTGKTIISLYDYSKSEEEPDIKVLNEKGAVVEAHINTFNENNQLVIHEIQRSDNGLKKYITTYDYNDRGSLSFIETLNHNGELQRRVIATFNEHGLLLSEDKSEYAIEAGGILTFTFNYEYTFHQ